MRENKIVTMGHSTRLHKGAAVPLAVVRSLLNLRSFTTTFRPTFTHSECSRVYPKSTFVLFSTAATPTFTSRNNSFKWFLAAIGLGTVLCAEWRGYFQQCLTSCETQTIDKMNEKKSSEVHGRRYFNFVVEAVDKASPSVVSITTSTKYRGDVTMQSSGSGIVVENGQYILTNAHVIRGVTSVKVKLSTGQVVMGEVTDRDEVVDLALIKMQLPSGVSASPVKFANSENVRPGEWVIAMGSPLLLTNTITCGIVSCVHRSSKELGLDHIDMEYIQTDTIITIGNSGGPLVNIDGEVVGINTLTINTVPGFSFAIPSNKAQSFLQRANKKTEEKQEKKAHGDYKIGITVESLTYNTLQVMKQHSFIPQDVKGGVLLVEVCPNSPAELAGLKKNDVVVSVNGIQVHSIEDILSVNLDEKIVFKLYRKNRCITCTVVPQLKNM